MPRCSKPVLVLWHGLQRDWNIFLTNDCSPIFCQGNTWSTSSAWDTLLSSRHDWHSGCLDNCVALILRHKGDEYLALVAFRSAVLLREFLPPCSIQNELIRLRLFVHPRWAHLSYFGTLGKEPQFVNGGVNQRHNGINVVLNLCVCGHIFPFIIHIFH